MAGRGRRMGYENRSVPLRRPGVPSATAAGEEVLDIPHFMNKVNEISTKNVDPILINDLEVMFKQLCTSHEALVNVLSNLHCKALCDHTFGEKVVVLMEHISSLEMHNVTVRSELLKFLQSDYHVKDTMSQSDKAKFLNAVMFLGGIYWRVKVCNKPIFILGAALLEYLDLLLQGEELQIKIFTMQIFLNGSNLLENEQHHQKYELLKHSIRKTLTIRNLSTVARCWLLLALDYMANNLKPIRGVIRDFYLSNLGDEYLNLELLCQSGNSENLLLAEQNSVVNHKPIEPQPIIKSAPKNNTKNLAEHLNHLDLSYPDSNDSKLSIKKDVDNIRQKMKAEGLIKHLGDSEKKNRKWQDGEKLSDDEKIWGLNERNKNVSQHDDRFQKDDDYYGIQLPRSAKPRKIQGRGGNDDTGTRKSLDADWKPRTGPNRASEPTNLGPATGEDTWD